jgi:hypothetical protein
VAVVNVAALPKAFPMTGATRSFWDQADSDDEEEPPEKLAA